MYIYTIVLFIGVFGYFMDKNMYYTMKLGIGASANQWSKFQFSISYLNIANIHNLVYVANTNTCDSGSYILPCLRY